jgi:hypothetical protein
MPRRKRPVLGVDYIIDTNGRAQFTREYLAKRGWCCEADCRFCPYLQTSSGGDSSNSDLSSCESSTSVLTPRLAS